MTITRSAYVTEGIDETVLIAQAQQREGDTVIHRHPFGEVCRSGCHIVQGRPIREPDRA